MEILEDHGDSVYPIIIDRRTILISLLHKHNTTVPMVGSLSVCGVLPAFTHRSFASTFGTLAAHVYYRRFVMSAYAKPINAEPP